jgi:hypothetical protein
LSGQIDGYGIDAFCIPRFTEQSENLTHHPSINARCQMKALGRRQECSRLNHGAILVEQPQQDFAVDSLPGAVDRLNVQ